MDFAVLDEAVDDRRHVVSPEGEIDVVSAPQLGRCLLGLAEEGKTGVVVDLSKVTFMDSTGLGVLLNGLRALGRRRGTLVLVSPNERVMRAFQITGFTNLMPIFHSREAALSAV
jgi:anti-sigma B factor antagonist